MRSTLLGVFQTLGTTAAFALAGVAAAALYPPPMPADPKASDPNGEIRAPVPAPDAEPAERWLVDGYNVIQVALLAGRERDAWWTGARRAELLERADAAPGRVAVEVVFDGPEPAAPRRGARAVFAPSADAWILDEVAAAGPTRPTVVTADRRLAARARRRGARVMAPAAFLARCGGGEPPATPRLARR
jgi:hypothetical protein